MRTVSVVICTYSDSRWDDLVAAVRSVERQTIPVTDTIVVIDHNPRLAARARSELGSTLVLENGGARGLSSARNTGVRAARGGIVAFLDDDAVAEPVWLEHLLVGYDDVEVVAVGGAIEPVWPESRPRWFPPEFDWVVGCTYRGMPEIETVVRSVIGCNMSFRRDVLERAGGFLDRVGRVGARPTAGEETELCIRIQQLFPGSKVLYRPSGRVHHRVTPARISLAYFRSRSHLEGVSKALTTKLVGAQDGLATVRTYTYRTLPRGVLRGFGEAARGDLMGLARSSAIAFGFGSTALGYLRGRLSRRATVLGRAQEGTSGQDRPAVSLTGEAG